MQSKFIYHMGDVLLEKAFSARIVVNFLKVQMVKINIKDLIDTSHRCAISVITGVIFPEQLKR